MLHLDPSTTAGAVDAALHMAPALAAPLTTVAALALAALRGGR